MSSPLHELDKAGVSIWLDDLSRDRIQSGSLAELISSRAVSGVTTNPTIFAGAFSKGDAYADQLAELSSKGVSASEAVFEATTQDVRMACDVFGGVYESTKGVDGRVSIEVEPGIAMDSAKTVAQAKGPDPQEVIQQAVKETNTVNRFNSVKQSIVSEFPILDVNSEFFNPQLRDQIHKIYNPMLAQGADPTEALIEATSLVVKAHGVLPLSEIIRQKEQELAEQGKKLTKEEAATKRKLEQVEKNIKAAQDTPPNMATTGKTTDSSGVLEKYDFQKMSLKEFDKIPDSELEMIENTLMMYN
jgi:hypothetical protein